MKPTPQDDPGKPITPQAMLAEIAAVPEGTLRAILADKAAAQAAGVHFILNAHLREMGRQHFRAGDAVRRHILAG